MTMQTLIIDVPANSRNPISTGLNFSTNAKVTIVSKGVVTLRGVASLLGAAKDTWNGPTGQPFVEEQYQVACIAPQAYAGALLATTGTIYTPVEGGLLNWTPPSDDNLSFVVNDTLVFEAEDGIVYNGYSDNLGTFQVTIQYDDDDLVGRERH